jgi:hypothetical protein
MKIFVAIRTTYALALLCFILIPAVGHAQTAGPSEMTRGITGGSGPVVFPPDFPPETCYHVASELSPALKVAVATVAQRTFQIANPKANEIDETEFNEWLSETVKTFPLLKGRSDFAPDVTNSRLSSTYLPILFSAYKNVNNYKGDILKSEATCKSTLRGINYSGSPAQVCAQVGSYLQSAPECAVVLNATYGCSYQAK